LQKNFHTQEKNLESVIESISTGASTCTTVLIRALREYLRIIRGSIEIQKAQQRYKEASSKKEKADALQKLHQVLGEKLELSSWLLKAAGEIFTKPIESLVDPLLEEFKKKEKEWLGLSFLKEENIAKFKAFIPIHIQHFILFAISNCYQLTHALTPQDECEFYQDLNYLFFTVYSSAVGDYLVVKKAQAISNFAILSIFKLQKRFTNFLTLSQQQSSLFGEVKFKDDYAPPIPLPEKKCSFEEDSVVVENKEKKKAEEIYQKYGVFLEESKPPNPVVQLAQSFSSSASQLVKTVQTFVDENVCPTSFSPSKKKGSFPPLKIEDSEASEKAEKKGEASEQSLQEIETPLSRALKQSALRNASNRYIAQGQDILSGSSAADGTVVSGDNLVLALFEDHVK
jgi:hypothetical protein